jgi:hypothetical protein
MMVFPLREVLAEEGRAIAGLAKEVEVREAVVRCDRALLLTCMV